jgi:putative autotransporter adhesin-like protein
MPIPLARLSSLLALPLASCIVVVDGNEHDHSLRGSGVRAEEHRPVPEFHAIELETGATVVVRVGAGSSLHLTGDDNLLAHVETKVTNGVLRIDSRDSLSFRCGLELVIETPALERFTIEGSGDVQIAGLAGERVELGIEGSGSLRAGGRTHDLVGSIEGSGSLELGELEAVHAHLSIEGSGEMDVRVVEALRYSIEGSGEIRYAGDPELGGTIEGSGDIAKRP